MGMGATPPVGSSPIAAPSSNMGSEATAIAMVQEALKTLGSAAMKTDPSSQLGQTLLECIKKLAKDAPSSQAGMPGSIQPQAMRNIASQSQQQAPMMALQRLMQNQPPPMAAAPTTPPPGAGE